MQQGCTLAKMLGSCLGTLYEQIGHYAPSLQPAVDARMQQVRFLSVLERTSSQLDSPCCKAVWLQDWHETLLLDVSSFKAFGWTLLRHMMGGDLEQLSRNSIFELADMVGAEHHCCLLPQSHYRDTPADALYDRPHACQWSC